MKQQLIEALEKKGFSRWTKGDKDRLYIKPTQIGLYLEHYNTGNIRYAELNGVRISNSSARQMVNAKCYIDIATGECVCNSDVYADTLVLAMETLIAEAQAELAEEEAEADPSEEEAPIAAPVPSGESFSDAIDAVLPDLDYFMDNYFFRGYVGDITNKCLLRRVVIRINDDGTLSETDYGYGEAMTAIDYHLSGTCVDIAYIVSDWMRGEADRTDVIHEASEALAEHLC